MNDRTLTPLKRARLLSCLTLDEAATKIGMKAANLSNIERAVYPPNAGTAAKIAAFFGLSELEVLYPERYIGQQKETA